MNKYKMLSGFLIVGLTLFGASSGFAAKPPETGPPTANKKFLPHPIVIPPLQSADSAMPCQEVRRWPKKMTFTGCDTQANKVEPPPENAKTFLKTYAQAMALRPDLADLKVVNVKKGLTRTITRFQQTFLNIPVLKAFISIHQRPSGRVTTIHTSYISEPLMIGAETPAISISAAKNIAFQGIRKLSKVPPPKSLAKSSATLSWLPVDDNRSVKLVWVVKTRTHKPRGDFYTLVNANTGFRLVQQSLIAFAEGTGMAHEPNPIQGSGILNFKDNNDATNARLNGQRIAVDLQGLAKGSTLLKGEFVDLSTFDSPTCPRLDGRCPDAENAGRAYVYTRDQAEFEQVVIYNAVDSVQRYLRDILHFQDAEGNATIRNFPTRAIAHWYADDQSFYSPLADNGQGVLYFGDGGVDDAEDADIIVHEFGHAIQHNQNPECFPGDNYAAQVSEARAIGEGFGDYFAASFYAEKGNLAHQALNAACVGEWDSSPYSSTNPTCLRRVDGSKRYPNDLVGEVHSDGEIWSAALWGIRTELSAPVTDQLVLEHHFNLDCSNGLTMPQAALEMVDTDKLLFAGLHQNILLANFCDRGILVGDACASATNLPTVVNVKADSTLALDAPDRNEGANPTLHLRPNNDSGGNLMRTAVAFDLSTIDSANVATARLVLTVQQNLGGWGNYGRNVVARPLKAADFPEGNGQWLDAPENLKTAGSGTGVTWNCAVDNDISNAVKDCSDGTAADANPFTAAPFVHTNDLRSGDEITWDVSDDVKDGASGWLLNVTQETQNISGEVAYVAKEGNPALAPRLEITFKTAKTSLKK